MKAAMLYGVKDLRVEDVQMPEVQAGCLSSALGVKTISGRRYGAVT